MTAISYWQETWNPAHKKNIIDVAFQATEYYVMVSWINLCCMDFSSKKKKTKTTKQQFQAPETSYLGAEVKKLLIFMTIMPRNSCQI